MFTRKITRAAVIAVMVLSLNGCAGLDDNQQRMVTGGVIGTAAGAVTTVITGGCIACGMAIGGAVGTAGGYLTSKVDGWTRGESSSASSSSNMTYSSNNTYGSNSSSNGTSADAPQGYPTGGYNGH